MFLLLQLAVLSGLVVSPGLEVKSGKQRSDKNEGALFFPGYHLESRLSPGLNIVSITACKIVFAVMVKENHIDAVVVGPRLPTITTRRHGIPQGECIGKRTAVTTNYYGT